MFEQNRLLRSNRHGSPVDFAGFIPAAVLSIWCVVSVLALEVNKAEEDEQSLKGSGGSNWMNSIFPVFAYNYHLPTGADIVCKDQHHEITLCFTFQEVK